MIVLHPKKNYKKRQGFIALMSVIIISIILILILTTLSLTGFYSRFNILDSEMKERSSADAESCIDEGILFIANGTSHLATTTVLLGTDQCTLGPIPASGNPRVFYAQSNMHNYFTTYKVSVDPVTFTILSSEEIATY